MDQNMDLKQLRKLAQSPAGQQLLHILQHQGGKELQDAVQKASSGDFRQAKQALSSLLDTPEAKQLLKQLEEIK
jgi:hypothetical protein